MGMGVPTNVMSIVFVSRNRQICKGCRSEVKSLSKRSKLVSNINGLSVCMLCIKKSG